MSGYNGSVTNLVQQENERVALLRDGALESLTTFSELTDKRYRASAMHELLAEKLELVEQGKIRRLAISMPPRHGKSELASVKFPAWALTRNKRRDIMQFGYTAPLAQRFGKKANALLKSERYLRFFNPIVDPKHDGAQEWQTVDGGAYFAAGIGGGGVGRGADILIVDDPIKNRQEANSETVRGRTWDWFISTALTRLSPTGVVIVILTRWHEDDLIGRLTNPVRVQEMKDLGFDDMNFEVLSLEALCENPAQDPLHREYGEALWPERWNVRSLQATKAQQGTYEWNSQYQQRPNPPEGNCADVTLIKYIERNEVPANLTLVRGWDIAYSEKEKADFTVGAYGCVQSFQEEITLADGRKETIKRERIYLVHIDRSKKRWIEQKQNIASYAEREAIGGKIGFEANSEWEPAFNELKTYFRGRVIVKNYAPNKDKMSRAMPWFAVIDGGEFYMVRGAWNQDFIDELKQFPNGVHDDQIDGVTVMREMSVTTRTLVVA